MNPRFAALIIVISCTALLSGCWSKKELTDLAIISAMGIDLDEEGRLVGTLQIINPSNVAGGLQGGGGTQGPPVSVYSSTGDSLVELSRRASRQLSRSLYYAHTNLVVISEEVAREKNISSILDALERDAEFRITAYIVVAHGTKASDLVKVLTPIDKIPSNKVIKTLKFTERQWGEYMAVNIQNTIKDLTSAGKEPLITGFRLNGDAEEGKKLENTQDKTEPSTTLSASGLGIFKGGKLIGWLEGKESRGAVWILDKVKQTAIGFDWKKKNESVIYQVVRQKTQVSAKLQNGKPKITINIAAEGDIGEVKVPVELTDPNLLLALEKEINKEIEREIMMAVKAAQKNKSDIFGFGQAVQRSYPKEWKKMQKNWNDDYFPELQAEVKAEAYIRRTGLRNNPHFPGK